MAHCRREGPCWWKHAGMLLGMPMTLEPITNHAYKPLLTIPKYKYTNAQRRPAGYAKS